MVAIIDEIESRALQIADTRQHEVIDRVIDRLMAGDDKRSLAQLIEAGLTDLAARKITKLHESFDKFCMEMDFLRDEAQQCLWEPWESDRVVEMLLALPDHIAVDVVDILFMPGARDAFPMSCAADERLAKKLAGALEHRTRQPIKTPYTVRGDDRNAYTEINTGTRTGTNANDGTNGTNGTNGNTGNEPCAGGVQHVPWCTPGEVPLG